MVKWLLVAAGLLAAGLAAWYWLSPSKPSQDGAALHQAIRDSQAEVKTLTDAQTKAREEIAALIRRSLDSERRADDWKAKAKAAESIGAAHKAELDRLVQERAELKKVETVAEGVAELRRLGYVR